MATCSVNESTYHTQLRIFTVKIARLAVMPASFIILSIANATVTKTEKIEMTVDSLAPACGLRTENLKATVGDTINYEVIGPQNGYAPFVNITGWDIKQNSLNPNLVYLDGIAYKFGQYGIPVAFENGSNIAYLKFSMRQRPNVSIPSSTEETTLTMTLTCFDQTDNNTYQKAKEYWLANGGLKKFIDYTSTLGWDFATGFGIQTTITDPSKIPHVLQHTPEFPLLESEG